MDVMFEIIGGTLHQRSKIVGGERQLRRPREVQEIRHHLTECLGLLPDAFDVRFVLRRQCGWIDQLPVSMDRCQTIAKLVCDSRGQLTKLCESVLQTKL